MSCLCCQSYTHYTAECTSTRAQTIQDAVSHWIMNRLQQLYTTTATSIPNTDSVHWLATSHHMTRLSRGDLFYLMSDVLYADPMYMKERLIYIYSLQTMALLSNLQGKLFVKSPHENTNRHCILESFIEWRQHQHSGRYMATAITRLGALSNRGTTRFEYRRNNHHRLCSVLERRHHAKKYASIQLHACLLRIMFRIPVGK